MVLASNFNRQDEGIAARRCSGNAHRRTREEMILIRRSSTPLRYAES
jgi:hypothetical protein